MRSNQRDASQDAFRGLVHFSARWLRRHHRRLTENHLPSPACSRGAGGEGSSTSLSPRRPAARRGVLLLVVLSMLAMFGLFAMTFVIVASQSKRTSLHQMRPEQFYDPYESLLHQGLLQVLRGSNNPASVLRPHSLLEDVYGNNSQSVQVSLVRRFDQVSPLLRVIATGWPANYRIERHLGAVFTVMGHAKPLSLRVVNYDPSSNEVWVLVDESAYPIYGPDGQPGRARVDDDSDNTVDNFQEFGAAGSDDVVRVGDVCVVNGPAFGGTGFGYNKFFYNVPDPSEKRILLTACIGGTTTTLTDARYALLPNPVDFEQFKMYFSNLNPPLVDVRNSALGYTDPAGPGGANEDYDAPDYQNMLMAATNDVGAVLDPSLHRKQLVWYWYQRIFSTPQIAGIPQWPPAWGEVGKWKAILQPWGQDGRADSNDVGWTVESGVRIGDRIVDFKRRFLLRPLAEDHPGFTGSNPFAQQAQQANLTGYNNNSSTPSDVNAVLLALWETHDPAIVPPPTPWDVDNNGDGVPDSVWVDLGMPPRPGPNGKLYKPLFAILAVDKDGCANVNVHGSLAQTLGDYYGQSFAYDGVAPFRGVYEVLSPLVIQELSLGSYGLRGLIGSQFADLANGGVNSTMLRRGQGMGPAEINLAPVFMTSTSDTAGMQRYRNMLIGRNGGGLSVEGRYGELPILAAGGVPAPGRTISPGLPAPPPPPPAGTFMPPIPTGDFDPRTDPLGFNKFVDFPDDYLTGIAPLHGIATNQAQEYNARIQQTSYGSLADLKGSMAIGLDLRGQPVPYLVHDQAVAHGTYTVGSATRTKWFDHARTNHPYELNVASSRARGLPTGSIDNPFSPAEFEPFLRPFDSDVGRLPARLALLTSTDATAANSVLLNPNRRHLFTTESWSVPVPPTALPSWMNTAIGGALGGAAFDPNVHPIDLLRARFQAANVQPPLTNEQLVTYARQMLPLEFLHGRRMNLNRPFGNGRDDVLGGDIGSVVDEPDESNAGEQYYYVDPSGNVQSTGPGNFNYGYIDANGDGNIDGADLRLLFARQLYVMAQLLVDPTYYPPWVPAGNIPERARWLAQWAVNVVDFRDRDSIMTRFQYDVTPFDADGWNSTGGPVVWGCERPELLITETLALHARRTEDLATPNKKVYPPQKDSDSDFDQRLRPLGSLFIEVFNPWSAVDANSGEFYVDRAPTPPGLAGQNRARGGVMLNQRTPNGQPVWRMIVVDTPDQAAADRDPDDPVSPAPVDRSIYFNDPGTLPGPVTEQIQFYTTSAMSPIGHNRYAVIGPDQLDSDGNRCYGGVTYVSRPMTPDPDPTSSTRYPLKQIALTAPTSVKPEDYQVSVDNNSTTYDSYAAQGKPPVAVVVDQARLPDGNPSPARMSVSEPVDGYAAPDLQWQQKYYSDVANPTQGDWVYTPPRNNPVDTDPLLRQLGMKPQVKKVYLQRLADPTRAFDNSNSPTANLYRTVDSMPIDLVVYNGWENFAPGAEPGVGSDDADVPVFRSRERGDTPPAAADRNLWAAEPWPRPTQADDATYDNQPDTDPNYRVQHVLKTSLGYLNKPFWFDSANPGARPLPTVAAPPWCEYAGDPMVDAAHQPLPWFNWNNRPFTSELELLLVPWERSSMLLDRYGMQAPGAPDPYQHDAIKPGTSQPVNFPHLPNFFQTRPGATAQYANLHRLLGLTCVPSRFVGTENFGNPVALANTMFAGPLNATSTYREPGRLNLNTVNSAAVLNAVLNRAELSDFGDSLGIASALDNSRRIGYGPNVLPYPPPTSIVNPVRSYGGANLVPTTQLREMILNNSGGDPEMNEINATLLRPDPSSATTPLFLHGSASTLPVNNTNRNPYFRYLELTRLGNLVTQQSNVYAVWITVGYFEVRAVKLGTNASDSDRPDILTDPNDTNRAQKFAAIYPDGYQLGPEMGSDTGEVKRHRAFFLIDRSIPVGFQRGNDLNVEDAVLLKRYIE